MSRTRDISFSSPLPEIRDTQLKSVDVDKTAKTHPNVLASRLTAISEYAKKFEKFVSICYVEVQVSVPPRSIRILRNMVSTDPYLGLSGGDM